MKREFVRDTHCATSSPGVSLRMAVPGLAFVVLALMTVSSAMGSETVLYSFRPYLNGLAPEANVCFGPDGIYGTAYGGGPNNAGVVWKINHQGSESTLYAFTGGSDGEAPFSSLVCNADGSVYGTTYAGGASGAGTVFRVDRNGHETVLYSFTGGTDGGYPFYGLVQDLAGNLYGTADGGGAYGQGVVFKLDTRGHQTVLYSFTGGADGGSPNNVILDLFGNIYGTTFGGGTDNAGVVFKLDRRGNETVLYSFTGGADGAYPYYGVVEDVFGNLYGTTANGGASGAGVVFRLDIHGNETVLYSFSGSSDGGYPSAGVTLDLFGNLYGTTAYGGSTGYGVVFKVDRHNNESVLYSFTGGTDGGIPNAGVVLDLFGNLYGDTIEGGEAGLGAVFKLNPNGHETVLYGFPASDGANPQAGVVQDSVGNLYGTTNGGGSHAAGIVYKIDTSGHKTDLYQFTGGTDGGNPFGGVILGTDGNLYGAAGGAGQYNAGLLYKMDLSGNETVLYSFTGGSDGAYPNGVARDSSGNLYGTAADGGTSGVGVVFKVDPSGHETVLHTFTGPDGKYPYAGVTLDSSGNIYGTTFYGGTGPCYFGCGVVYKIDTGGNYSILHTFTFGADGGDPWGDLILDTAGNLYGNTWSGGPPSGDYPGVVFKIDTMGNFSTLYTFSGFSDGGGPRSNMVFDSAGNLYGTTQYGGIGGCPYFGCGVLFELNPSGQQTVLYSFSGGSDGSEPGTGLIRDASGNLYGTTSEGGSNGAGVVYKVTPGPEPPAQRVAAQRPLNLSDLKPKHPLPWQLPNRAEAEGICQPHMPPAVARACRESAR